MYKDEHRGRRVFPPAAGMVLLPLFLSFLFFLCGPSPACGAPALRRGAITAQEFQAAQTSSPDPARPFAVVGYLPEYRQSGFPYADVFAHGLTHLIFFSAEVDPVTRQLVHTEDRLPQGAEWEQIRRDANAHGVKLMLCIGGGGRSAGFASLVADPLSRIQFTKQLNALLLEKHLDGVDINWEYPQGEEQWRHFARFVRELKSSLGHVIIWDDVPTDEAGTAFTSRVPDHDVSAAGREEEQTQVLRLWHEQQARQDVFLGEKRAGKARRSNHRVRVRDVVVSMAAHPHPQIAAMLNELNILPWLDYLHWMAYDHMVDGKPHSSVDYAEFVLSDRFIGALSKRGRLGDKGGAASGEGGRELRSLRSPKLQRALEAAMARPGPDHRAKLTLGIPFYGRHMEDRRLEPETYARLAYFVAQWVRKEHPDWRLDGSGEEVKALSEYAGYAFSGYRDVQAKMRLARHTGPPGGLAGIMIWELGQDLQPPSAQPLSLMRAVAEQLRLWNVSRPAKTAVHAPAPPPPEPKAEGGSSSSSSGGGGGAEQTDSEWESSARGEEEEKGVATRQRPPPSSSSLRRQPADGEEDL